MQICLHATMKKILLIEYDPEIIQLLNIHLAAPYYQLTACINGMEAVDKLMHEAFDLIILDIMLPDIDGFKVCRLLRERGIDYPILMLTSLADETDKVVALELGADDYVTKPFGIRELIARVKALLRRYDNQKTTENASSDNNDIIVKDLFINKYKRQALLCNKRIELTAKEFDLLYLLASNRGKVFSRHEILELIWGFTFQGYEHTVTSHINRLRIKIEPNINEPVYILTAWGVGYRFTE